MSESEPLGNVEPCKWCSHLRSEKVFEGVKLCSKCFDKATFATENPSLCTICSKIFTNESVTRDLFSDYGYDHSGAEMLRVSSERGCELCRMLWLQDPNSDPNRLHSTRLYLHAERKDQIETDDSGTAVVDDINLLYFSSEEGQYRLNLSVSALPGDAAASYITQRPPARNLGEESTMKVVRDWLKECLEKHDETEFDKLPLLPTRVVDVGIEQNSDVKLVEVPNDSRAQYVTLSYCWGRPRFLVTLKENIDDHKKALGVEKLPQTFRDAIYTTRQLGFRYLWIDALCIIQDSSEDKAKEIGKMGAIYNDSTLTMAVVSAETVAEGFLRTKTERSVTLPYKSPDGQMGSVQVQVQKETDLWNEWLYTRAWCLQENLLSQRLLLYTNTEVIWQCDKTKVKRLPTSHVSYVRDDPRLGRSPFNRLPSDVLRPSLSHHDGEANGSLLDSERYTIWRALVENYTRRNLTVASDRLPALAGVAQKFAKVWQDNYIQGVWERQLLPSLAWRRNARLEDKSQPYHAPLADYRAPSWSWASIDGPVQFDGRFDLGNARGLGAKVRPCRGMDSEDEDAIMVEGYMIPVLALPSYLDASNRGFLCLDNHDEDSKWPWWADNFVNGLIDEEREKALCVLLGEGRSGGGKMMSTTALVILPVPGKDENTFQRIGFWECSVKGTSKLWAGVKNKRTVRVV